MLPAARLNRSSYPQYYFRLGSRFGGHGVFLGWDYNKNFDICHHIFIQISVGILSRFEATGY